MSPIPEHAEPITHPTPIGDADVIDIAPRLAVGTGPDRHPVGVDGRRPDTVVLGRSVPHDAGSITGTPIVDEGGLGRLLLNRRERYYSAPPPRRVRSRGWMLSSLVIAGGGLATVMAAGEFGEVPLVATVAVLATVLCGAVLVAAQITHELRRSRRDAGGWAVSPNPTPPRSPITRHG